MLLSLIVPIYNVEKYIIDCIESIVVQLKPEHKVEIICVNDGTPDASMNILREYLSKLECDIKSKFRLVDQENKGLSGARNTGLEISSGNYIGFLDSDDKLYSNYLDVILDKIDHEIFDILDFNIKNSEGLLIRTQIENIEDKLEAAFKAENWFAWARIYDKKIFNNKYFSVGLYYEDLDLIPILYLSSSRIIHIDEVLYWYRTNPDGITQSTSVASKEKTIKSLEKIHFKYREIEKKDNMYINYMAFNTLFLMMVYSCRLFDLNRTIELFKKNSFHTGGADFDFLLSKSKKIFKRYPFIFIFICRFYFLLKSFFNSFSK